VKGKGEKVLNMRLLGAPTGPYVTSAYSALTEPFPAPFFKKKSANLLANYDTS
jgi:hypothetical protein